MFGIDTASLHAEKFLHRKVFTQRSFYTQQVFTQRILYTQIFLHATIFYTRPALTQKGPYTEKPLHREVFTQKPLHREEFTHRSFCAQQTFTHRKFLHREAFTHRSFYTPPPFTHRKFYTQHIFTQGSFYTPATEDAFGVPPATGPGTAKNGVFAFGGEVKGHNDVDGTANGDAGIGTTGAAEDVDVVVTLLFASCSSTYKDAFFMTAKSRSFSSI